MRRRGAKMRLLLAGLAAVALVGMSACGDDDDDDGATTTTTEAEETPTTEAGAAAPDDPEAAEAEIRANVEELFTSLADAGTAEDEAAKEAARQEVVDLIENGEDFREGVQAVEGLAAGLTVEVKSVEFTSDTTATIGYDLLINGSPVLPDAQGEMVLVDGTWKLSADTWSALEALADTGGGGDGEGGTE